MQDFKAYEIKKEDIIVIAQKMKNEGRRLVMIHGYINKEEQNVIVYQYEVGNCVESYSIVGETNVPSISNIYDLAAAWPEEELYELMGLKFDGLQMRGRLFLPDTMLDGKGQIVVTPLSELTKKAQGKKEDIR